MIKKTGVYNKRLNDYTMVTAKHIRIMEPRTESIPKGWCGLDRMLAVTSTHPHLSETHAYVPLKSI